MPDSKEQNKNKALHELMEEDFQQLVDVIEQKQMVHEGISFKQPVEIDPVTQAAQQLQKKSQELGADTLSEYFNELENNARSGLLDGTSELLGNIQDEFEKVKNILSKD